MSHANNRHLFLSKNVTEKLGNSHIITVRNVPKLQEEITQVAQS